MDLNYSSSAKEIFTTLASVQAAIFAIVFSVTILGVQLSASHYSPRLINVFRNDRAYIFTSLVFLLSIGIAVFGLYWNPSSGVALRMMVHVAGVLSITALFVLYLFVDRTLYSSTPEGLLNRIKERMSAERIVEQAANADDEPTEPDPYLNVLAVVRSALQEQDSATSSLGLDILADRTENLLQSEREAISTPGSPVADSIDQLCTVRLPRFIETTVEQERTDEAEAVIECLEDIGKAGIQAEIGYVPGYITEGLADSITNIGYESHEEFIRKKMSDTSYKCLKSAGEAELWGGAADGTSLVTWRASQSILDRNAPQDRGRAYENLLLLGVPKIHSNAVGEVNDQIDDDDVDWLHAEHLSDFSDLSADERVLHACYVGMCEVTSAIIRNELATERELVDWRSIGSGWRECVTSAEESDLTSLFEQWLATGLYLEYLRAETSDVTLSNFYDISTRTDPENTIQVIDGILDGEIDAKSQIDHVPGYGHPIELPPLTGYVSPPVSSPQRSISDWLEIRKAALEARTDHN